MFRRRVNLLNKQNSNDRHHHDSAPPPSPWTWPGTYIELDAGVVEAGLAAVEEHAGGLGVEHHRRPVTDVEVLHIDPVVLVDGLPFHD